MSRSQTLGLVAAIAVLVLVAVMALGVGKGSNQDRLTDNQVSDAAPPAAATKADDPARRCAGQEVYDKIKRQLFDQAARTRGSDADAFARLADVAVLRVDNPVLESEDQGLGLIRCAGQATLDLPPGVQVVGGRHSLGATVHYALQAAADQTGDVLTVQNADEITVPLATLGRAAGAPANTLPLPGQPGSLPPIAPVAPAAPAPSAPPPVATPAPPPPSLSPRRTGVANPSFPCVTARTRGERAVCSDDALAALDRQMAAAYGDAAADADGPERELLRDTAHRFYAFRDSCTSSACIAGAYRDRIREIRDIASGNWAPPR